jgi:hypothetical protein
MKRYWILAGAAVLAAGLAAGLTLAAMAPGGGGPGGMHKMPGGPPGGGPGMQQGEGPGGPGANHPMPPGPPPIIGRLEADMSNPLSDADKKQIRDAAETLHQAIKTAHEAFMQKLAEISKLPIDKIRSILPPPPPPPGGPGGGQGPGPKGPPPPPPHTPGAK